MPKKTIKKPTKKTQPRPIPMLLRPVRRLRALRDRRAHKSFQLTRRRDIPKRPKLPGYFAFTISVFRFVWGCRRLFAIFLLIYSFVSLALVGLSQQDQYSNVIDTFKSLGPELAQNGIGAVAQTLGIFGSTIIGSFNASLTQVQQLYLVGVYIISWLVLVWLIRQCIGGNKIKFRDALYNACAPIVSTFLILVLFLAQLIPGSIGILIFSLAAQNGVLHGGVEAMLFGIAALLTVVLSLYWLASSFFALIIVTLPGTYPMRAIRSASELALGRRTSLLFRLLWLVPILLLLAAIIIVPIVAIDRVLQTSGIPLVAIFIQVAGGVCFVYGVSYVYLLYRKMIDA